MRTLFSFSCFEMGPESSLTINFYPPGGILRLLNAHKKSRNAEKGATVTLVKCISVISVA